MSTAAAIKSEIPPIGEVEAPDATPLQRAADYNPGEEADADARASFKELADELEAASAGLSSTRRAMTHPAFLEILALGEAAIPGLIDRLRSSDNRPLWLRVLGTITPFPPGANVSTIDEAADVWINWGRFAS